MPAIRSVSELARSVARELQGNVEAGKQLRIDRRTGDITTAPRGFFERIVRFVCGSRSEETQALRHAVRLYLRDGNRYVTEREATNALRNASASSEITVGQVRQAHQHVEGLNDKNKSTLVAQLALQYAPERQAVFSRLAADCGLPSGSLTPAVKDTYRAELLRRVSQSPDRYLPQADDHGAHRAALRALAGEVLRQVAWNPDQYRIADAPPAAQDNKGKQPVGANGAGGAERNIKMRYEAALNALRGDGTDRYVPRDVAEHALVALGIKTGEPVAPSIMDEASKIVRQFEEQQKQATISEVAKKYGPGTAAFAEIAEEVDFNVGDVSAESRVRKKDRYLQLLQREVARAPDKYLPPTTGADSSSEEDPLRAVAVGILGDLQNLSAEEFDEICKHDAQDQETVRLAAETMAYPTRIDQFGLRLLELTKACAVGGDRRPGEGELSDRVLLLKEGVAALSPHMARELYQACMAKGSNGRTLLAGLTTQARLLSERRDRTAEMRSLQRNAIVAALGRAGQGDVSAGTEAELEAHLAQFDAVSAALAMPAEHAGRLLETLEDLLGQLAERGMVEGAGAEIARAMAAADTPADAAIAAGTVLTGLMTLPLRNGQMDEELWVDVLKDHLSEAVRPDVTLKDLSREGLGRQTAKGVVPKQYQVAFMSSLAQAIGGLPADRREPAVQALMAEVKRCDPALLSDGRVLTSLAIVLQGQAPDTHARLSDQVLKLLDLVSNGTAHNEVVAALLESLKGLPMEIQMARSMPLFRRLDENRNNKAEWPSSGVALSRMAGALHLVVRKRGISREALFPYFEYGLGHFATIANLSDDGRLRLGRAIGEMFVSNRDVFLERPGHQDLVRALLAPLMPFMRGADFSGFTAHGINCSSGDCANAKMKGWNFSVISQTDFSGADLKGAEFPRETRGAKFSNADLRDVDISGKQFQSCSFIGANLREANFGSSEVAGPNFSGSFLVGQDLRGKNFFQSKLSDSDLTGADLSGARLRQAEVTATNFTDANLTNVDLSEVVLKDVNFIGADLRGVRVAENPGEHTLATFITGRCNLLDAKLDRATVSAICKDFRALLDTGFFQNDHHYYDQAFNHLANNRSWLTAIISLSDEFIDEKIQMMEAILSRTQWNNPALRGYVRNIATAIAYDPALLKSPYIREFCANAKIDPLSIKRLSENLVNSRGASLQYLEVMLQKIGDELAKAQKLPDGGRQRVQQLGMAIFQVQNLLGNSYQDELAKRSDDKKGRLVDARAKAAGLVNTYLDLLPGVDEGGAVVFQSRASKAPTSTSLKSYVLAEQEMMEEVVVPIFSEDGQAVLLMTNNYFDGCMRVQRGQQPIWQGVTALRFGDGDDGKQKWSPMVGRDVGERELATSKMLHTAWLDYRKSSQTRFLAEELFPPSLARDVMDASVMGSGSIPDERKWVENEKQQELGECLRPLTNLQGVPHPQQTPELIRLADTFHSRLREMAGSLIRRRAGDEIDPHKEAHYLRCFGAMLSKLSSAHLFGTEYQSPEAVRWLTIACLNTAEELDPGGLRGLDSRLSELAGKGSAFTCTSVVFNQLEMQLTEKTRGNKEFDDIMSSVIPRSWRKFGG
ncbi:pentapeptide repeat-containing protein [Hyphomicrobium sp. MC1]|uniref:pentapeptide repeat-containing protein n=1 Tax=Hyphomicrobium sp. (strain MC1) TaxID=717785 RepID=UPI000213EFD4|nr:pentapeptide repeat-containing protein [Hyphomicrobium sp. MC1]CCB66673.1 protein of unknown function [Hyphomicrobium sp. MC1]